MTPLRKELTLFELIRLLLALVVAATIFLLTSEVAYLFLPEMNGLIEFVISLFLAVFLPPFFAILIATLIPSWRYRTIAATLMLMAVTIWYVLDIPFVLTNGWALLVTMIRVSVAMSGALAANWLWHQLKQGHQARAKTLPVTVEPAQQMPKPSLFLLGLSLVSIPATYLTIFAAAFLVVGYSALLLLGLLELPQVPVFLLFAALLAPLVAVWAALRALGAILRPRPAFQPAHQLELRTHPQTSRMIKEVCTAVGTRQPQQVLVHAEPTFFVTEQKLQTFDGPVKGRTLALGLPILPHLTDQEFKAILAHEFAHFSGRDTLYSVWVAQVYRGLGESITQLQSSMAGAEGLLGLTMNFLLWPSLLFLILFYDFFASIDAIISRARELRADWIAATICGRDAFVSSLQKVVQYSAHFSEHQDELIRTQTGAIYQEHRRLVRRDSDELQTYLNQAMAAEEHAYASHPTLRTRIASVPQQTTPYMSMGIAFYQEFAADEERLSTSVGELMRYLHDSGELVHVAEEPAAT
jgi:Zn-dependent protease with chaperone function